MKTFVAGLVLLLLCSVMFLDAAPEEERFALEGNLRVHPKYMFRFYLDGFGDGQSCALLKNDKLEQIQPGSRIRVEGKFGSRFHKGDTKDNPSPFPPDCYIYMNVEAVKVLRTPTK